MYLVLMLRDNRMISAAAFRNFLLAEIYADDLIVRNFPYSPLPEWEEGPYQNVFEKNGFTIMIEPCDGPEPMDQRFQCNKYGVNLV